MIGKMRDFSGYKPVVFGELDICNWIPDPTKRPHDFRPRDNGWFCENCGWNRDAAPTDGCSGIRHRADIFLMAQKFADRRARNWPLFGPGRVANDA